MQAIETLLRESPRFSGMSPEQLTLIAGCGANVHFSEGEVLFREGEPADTFYLIRHGSVAVELHNPPRGAVLIETIDDGEVLGWSWLFPPYRWHFDARAVTLVRATAFNGACLRGKCLEDPAFGYELMSRFAQILIERLHSTRLRLLDVYGRGS